MDREVIQEDMQADTNTQAEETMEEEAVAERGKEEPAGEEIPETSAGEVVEEGVPEETEDVLDTEAEAVIETPEETIARLEQELAEARARAEEAVDRLQRTAAEFQNVRKRQERQLQESIARATERLLIQLLPVLDDFDLAFQNVPESLSEEEAAWVDGFRRIQKKLTSILEEEGLAAIEEAGPFDPNRHEAVTHEPNGDVESGHIIQTLRTGYEYKDRVLRPALVRVAQ